MQAKRKRRLSDAPQPELGKNLYGICAVTEKARHIAEEAGLDLDLSFLWAQIADYLNDYESYSHESVPELEALVASGVARILLAAGARRRKELSTAVYRISPNTRGSRYVTEREKLAAVWEAGYTPSSWAEAATLDTSVVNYLLAIERLDKVLGGGDMGENVRRLRSLFMDHYADATDQPGAGTWPISVGESRCAELGVDFEMMRDAIVRVETQRHMGLAWQIANRMSKSYHDYDPETLVAWAWQGLSRALLAFDPSSGNRFSTYAVQKIQGAILDGVRSESHLPKRLTAFVKDVTNAEDRLTAELCREPALEELANEVGATVAQLIATRHYQKPASIEEMAQMGEDDTEWWAPATDDDPEAEGMAREELARVIARIRQLSPEEQEIIRLVIFEEQTLTETGRRTGMSSTQVRRIRDNVLDMLAEEFAEAS